MFKYIVRSFHPPIIKQHLATVAPISTARPPSRHFVKPGESIRHAKGEFTRTFRATCNGKRAQLIFPPTPFWSNVGIITHSDAILKTHNLPKFVFSTTTKRLHDQNANTNNTYTAVPNRRRVVDGTLF